MGFVSFGIEKVNPDPDLLTYYYPMAETLLSGKNPYSISEVYQGGILWIVLLTIPLLIYNDPIADAIFIAMLYLISVLVFYKLSQEFRVDPVKATQIFSLTPLIWLEVRWCQDDIFQL